MDIKAIRLSVVVEFSDSVSQEVADATLLRICDHLERDYNSAGFSPDDAEEYVTGFRVKMKYLPEERRSGLGAVYGNFGRKCEHAAKDGYCAIKCVTCQEPDKQMCETYQVNGGGGAPPPDYVPDKGEPCRKQSR